MALSGIFEAAQKAADIYLQSVKENAEDTAKIEDIQEGAAADSHGD
ncbi:MAG: hypothetical protein IJN11_01670 [Oscillospiraceae bacterium]|nr:hypothetical protein [Oscillospiraceae bacterium]